MANYALIACVKTKAAHEARALQLYTSPLFRKSLLHAMRARCQPFVLSAEFGLVAPDQTLPPYEKTLNTMKAQEVKQWANRINSQLRQLLSPQDTVHLYAGQNYIRPLLPALRSIGCKIQIPIEGALGVRLSLLKKINEEDQLHFQINDYHSTTKLLAESSEQGILVKALHGRSCAFPTRGLYQFVDPTEKCQFGLPGRITRIGTHAVSARAKSTLKGRINTHRGPKSGIGSHRSSIFRLHVGNAIKRSAPNKWDVPTWSEGMTASASVRNHEAKLEVAVSKHIGAHRVYWLEISDEPGPASDRAFLERNIIGLLSSANLLRPASGPNWIGHLSDSYRIALSGLWNLDHLFIKPHSAFLDVYKFYVEQQIKGKPPPNASIAPSRWRQEMAPQLTSKQLDLL